MKKLITAIAMIFVLFSCQKELTKPDKNLKSDLSAKIRNNGDIFTEFNSYPIDETRFDSCTNENVHLIGVANGKFYYTIIDNILYSNYELRFEGVTGVGLIRNSIYTMTSYFANKEKVLLTGDPNTYQILRQNATTKAILTSDTGSKNAMFTYSLHFVAKESGVIYLEKISYEYSQCK